MTRPLATVRFRLLALACVLGLAPMATAQTVTVREIARLSTEGGYDLQGIGLVVGLPGTGDSGKELATARPLAQVLQLNGNPVPDLKQLEKTKSVALVMITCRVPRGGARKNDQLDITISTIGSAQSLKGGQLYVSPLLGPIPGSPVFAMASGPVMLLDPTITTTARVAGGAQIIRDLVAPTPDTHFRLVLEPHYRGYASAAQVATAINDNYFASPSALGMRVARAIDDREVLVVIPEGERPDPTPFVADIMITQLATELLKLPARVICNVRSGTITFTGDVRISPVAVSANGINIASTTPPLIPTPADPLVSQTEWLGISTEDASATSGTRLQDLLDAFAQLQVPASDKIKIIQQIHKMGKLHAELVME